ncbi:MAG TPA: membrane lipoprotein lipid attachment site-containing protein [Candidatus Onthocola stercoravium]|nr:membrane lipoprotein lipid attachment site-containing protein [Candidatus Onthocola stercoravium]
MKRFYILMLLFIMFILTGCSSDAVDIDELTAVVEYQYDTTIQCEAFDKNIKYFNYGSNNNWIVTEDNDVYVYSTYERYSNNSNCIKIADKFDDDIIQVDTEDNWSVELGRYIGNTTYYNSNLQQVTVDTKNYQIEREKLSISTSVELSADINAINDSEYIRYRKTNPCTAFAINGDNNIYIMRMKSTTSGNNPLDKSIIDNEEVAFSVPDDETILDFYYSSDAAAEGCYFETSGTIETDVGKKYILTDKSYYRPMLVDETCQIYLDVPCTYEWKRDEELSKIRNDILYRDEQNLILSNGRVYFNSAYMVN